MAESSPAESSHWWWWLSAVSSQRDSTSYQCLGVSGSISRTRSRGCGPLLNSNARGTTVDQRSGEEWKEDGGFFFLLFLLSVWISLHEYIRICLWMYSWERSETLTSPQSSDALLQPVHLAGLILAWILVDDRQVLIPVAPVHLIHPVKTKHQWSW